MNRKTPREVSLLPPFPPCQRTAGAASGVAGSVLLSRGSRTRTPKLSLACLGEKARRERFNVGPADTLYSSPFHCHVCSTPGGGHIAKQSVATVTARSTNLNTLFTSLYSEYSLLLLLVLRHRCRRVVLIWQARSRRPLWERALCHW